jgi:hypothetical protein
MARRTIFGGGGALGSGLALRLTSVATTSSLANGATDSTTTIALAVGFVLYSIQTSRPARVRLYTTPTARTADLSRGVEEDPEDDAGVIVDYVTADTDVHSFGPIAPGASLEAPPVASIAMSVTNYGTTGTVAVTLVYLATEGSE